MFFLHTLFFAIIFFDITAKYLVNAHPLCTKFATKYGVGVYKVLYPVNERSIPSRPRLLPESVLGAKGSVVQHTRLVKSGMGVFKVHLPVHRIRLNQPKSRGWAFARLRAFTRYFTVCNSFEK